MKSKERDKLKELQSQLRTLEDGVLSSSATLIVTTTTAADGQVWFSHILAMEKCH